MYEIMTEELVIHDIWIYEVAGRGDTDSSVTSLEDIMPFKLQNNYEISFVRCVTLPRLVVREKEWWQIGV